MNASKSIVGPSSKPRGLAEITARARSWALCLFVTGILVKLAWIVWCVVDGTLTLRGWEWATLPLISTYQHLLFGVACFGLYVILMLPGLLAQPLRAAGVVIVTAFQVAAVLFFVAALRMSLVLGTPPTFALLEAGAQGGVLGSSLIQPENLPFTLAGATLATLTVLASVALGRRWSTWPGTPRLALGIGALALWVTAGSVVAAHAHSELHHAHTEPVSFFLSELFQQRAERHVGAAVTHDPEAYRTSFLYDVAPVERTGRHANNRERWRQTKRNVVLIVLESVHAKNASFYGPVVTDGEERETTPNLTALREHMLLAKNHYAVHPTSMEDLFSIACSLYPYPLRPTITEVNPTIPCGSMPELLVDAGYVAGLFHSGHFSFWRKELFFSDRGFSVMLDADMMPNRAGAYEYNWGIDERVTARAIAEFIREHREESFFVEYIPVWPHSPYRVPSSEFEVWRGGERIDDYHNALHFLDHSIEVILDALRDEDLMDDTLLVVVADHGEAFDEHPGNRSHSAFVYEENIHVPLGFHNPILFSGAPAVQRVTNHLDILPTVADLLDLPRAPAWQGRSLLEDGPSRMTYFYSVSGRQLVGLRDGRWKVIWNRTTRRTHIFDLLEDPGEQQDLSEQFADRIGPYHQLLSRWRTYQLALIPRFGRQNADVDDGIYWLADLRPSLAYQPHPYDPVADHSVAGRDLQIDWVPYEHGLGTHADSWYTYDLEGLNAERLVGRVGRDRRMQIGQLRAYVFVDGVLAIGSGPLRAGTPAVGFDIDVSNAQQVTFAAWVDEDTGRSDHVDWVDLRLITSAESGSDREAPISLAGVRPSGANGPGLEARDIAALPHGRIQLSDERVDDGLVIPGGATLHYDIRPLGATGLRGRLYPDGHGEGAPAELVEILIDDEEVWSAHTSRMEAPRDFDVEIPIEARLLTLRTSSTTEEAAQIVLGQLILETSDDARAARRELMAHIEPRSWELALVPPVSASSSSLMGWSRLPDGTPLRVEDRDVTHSFWMRPTGRATWRLQRLGTRHITGHVAALGSESCRIEARIAVGAQRLWTSGELRPGRAPRAFTVEFGDALPTLEATTSDADATEDCRLLWIDPVVRPEHPRTTIATDGGVDGG